MFIRNCPNCKKELTYTTKFSMMRQEKLQKLCKSCTVKNEYKSNPNKNKGSENGRSGRTLMDVMINKYGEVEAKVRYSSWKSNLNSFGKGELNPQYGKSPFINGGMSYKGWYNNIFFRSSLELLFLVENYNLGIVSAENSKFRIEYNFNNIKSHYYPDFYIESQNSIYEIKSKKWMSFDRNKAKIEAASKEFKIRGINYKVLCEYDIELFKKYNSDWQKVIYDFIYEMKINKEIKLTDKSLDKLKLKLSKTNRIEKLKQLNMTN